MNLSDAAGLHASKEKERISAKRSKAKGGGANTGGLSAEEIKQCKVFFKTFDRDQASSVNAWELRLALEAMGRTPSDGDVEALMEELDAEGTGRLEFAEFLRALQIQKRKERNKEAENDLVHAFVAMGGNADRTGFINAESLRKVIKDDFGLTIKIDELLDDLDSSSDGFVNFDEFQLLLGDF